jgi:hypothetical protein
MENDNLSTHERIQKFYEVDEITWSSVEDLGSGIFVYHDVIKPEFEVIKRLESVLDDPSNHYSYSEALVGYNEKMPDYRDCYDFKYKKSHVVHDTSEAGKELVSIWDYLHFTQLQAVKHYAKTFNIGELRYWEAMNFVKYGPNQHFQEHHDHGYSYNCVVSLVAYPNDDYEGGELYFRLQNLNIKPKAGDLFVFPSNFMYPHQAKLVTSGTKHSIVTMLDFSDKYHKMEFYQETGS